MEILFLLGGLVLAGAVMVPIVSGGIEHTKRQARLRARRQWALAMAEYTRSMNAIAFQLRSFGVAAELLGKSLERMRDGMRQPW